MRTHAPTLRAARSVAEQAIFGVRGKARRAEFEVAVKELLAACTTPLAVLPVLRQELGGVRPGRRSCVTGNALLKDEMDRRKGTEGREDILTLLMNAQYDDGTRPTELERSEEVRTMLVGGHRCCCFCASLHSGSTFVML